MLSAGLVQRANMHHRAKRCANRSNLCRNMAVMATDMATMLHCDSYSSAISCLALS